MKKTVVNKASEMLANMADKMVLQKGCCTVWGEVKLPECMKNSSDQSEKKQNDNQSI